MMRERTLQWLPWLGMTVFAMLAWIRPAGSTPLPRRHPHIRAATIELREAKAKLETAAHDFCGHRAQAIQDIDQTLRQLQEALACAEKR